MRRDILMLIGMALTAVAIGVFIFFLDPNLPSSSSSAVANNDAQSAVTVPITKLAQGSHSTVSRRVNYFITSPSHLQYLWKMIDAAGTPPAIDFKKEAVLAVFAGERPTTGYAIEVSKVLDSSSRLVSITLAKPDDSCMTGQSLTAPYEIVAVPTTSLPLAHEDISTTVSCKN